MSGKLNIDGGQAKEEEHVSSYTPIREAETGILRISSAIQQLYFSIMSRLTFLEEIFMVFI